VVQLDRRRNSILNDAGVREKFGVGPSSIPDYRALVGDSSDGYPGLRGWGKKTAATVLARYLHLESIPRDAAQWDPMPVRGIPALAASLRDNWDDAMLFRTLATLRTDAPVFETVAELEWKGATEDFDEVCRRLGAPDTADAARRTAPE
jgi:5'-3' exonuclease